MTTMARRWRQPITSVSARRVWVPMVLTLVVGGGGSCPAMNNAILTQLGVKGLDVLCDGASILMYILFLGWMHASFILGRSLIGGG